ncbi:MAG: Gx transporter family protein [Faecalibacterium sp.]
MPQNRRSYEKTRRIALSGLLFALAMALSFIEGTLTIPGLLPGMKLGLANIVVMYALFFMGPRQALVLDVLKALFVFLVSGFTAGFLSLCGGLLSPAGDVGAVLSAAGAAHLVHPVRMRRTGPQHRPAAGRRRDHLVLAVASTMRRSCWCWAL